MYVDNTAKHESYISGASNPNRSPVRPREADRRSAKLGKPPMPIVISPNTYHYLTT